MLSVCSNDCSNKFARNPTHLFKSDHSSLTGKDTDSSQDFAACGYCDLFLMSSVCLCCGLTSLRTDFKQNVCLGVREEKLGLKKKRFKCLTGFGLRKAQHISEATVIAHAVL